MATTKQVVKKVTKQPKKQATKTPKEVKAPVKNPTEDQLDKEINKVEKVMEKKEEVKVFQVHQAKWFIRTKAYRTAIPMYKIPADIRQYLLNKGFGTNVWEKDKAWLERHHADMEMIERLKKFISENYL